MMAGPALTRDLRFRDAVASDGPAMLALHRAAIFAVPDRFYDDAMRRSWASGLTGDSYRQSMTGGETFELASDGSGRVVGFCGVKDGEVCGLYVHPDVQGGGVGSALLARAEARIADAGNERSRIVASLNAQSFYESRGWTLSGFETRKSRGGDMQKVALMEKRLVNGAAGGNVDDVL